MHESAQYLPPQLRRRRFGRFDALTLGLMLLAGGWLAYRVLVEFKYPWQWGDIPQYLAYRDESGQWRSGVLGQGLALTLRLSLWASALAMVWGLMLALGRLSASRYLQLTARTVVEVSRNIPPLILVFIGFYFLSARLLPWPALIGLIRDLGPAAQGLAEMATTNLRDLDVFFPAVIALALYEAAYFAEIFRGAIIAVDQGQGEASWCLGLSRYQRYRYVILPQALRKAGPQMAGQFIATVKESSIVSVLSLAELTYSAMKLSATFHHLFEIWLTAAALYFALNFALSLLFQRLES